MTTVVTDTGDVEQVRKYAPRDATTNPTLLAKAATMAAYDGVVQRAVDYVRARDEGSFDERLDATVARLSVEFGLELLAIVPGRVSTEVDARLSYDTAATTAAARRIVAWYEESGIGRDRVLLKIASTWAGIRAAEILEREGIHCNLTLLFGFHQALACAEAKVTLVSPYVGRILDWHKRHARRDFAPAQDPGVQSVRRIFAYYKTHDVPTEVMAASFRSPAEILELAGCDLLTISPELLAELDGMHDDVVRRLDPATASSVDVVRAPLDAAGFAEAHEQDRMAHDELGEGIDAFSIEIEDTKRRLADRVAA